MGWLRYLAQNCKNSSVNNTLHCCIILRNSDVRPAQGLGPYLSLQNSSTDNISHMINLVPCRKCLHIAEEIDFFFPQCKRSRDIWNSLTKPEKRLYKCRSIRQTNTNTKSKYLNITAWKPGYFLAHVYYGEFQSAYGHCMYTLHPAHKERLG